MEDFEVPKEFINKCLIQICDENCHHKKRIKRKIRRKVKNTMINV